MTKQFELLISEEAILQKVASLASSLDALYKGEEFTLVMVLKGSLCFVADLIRSLNTPCVIETIRSESYGMKGSQRGELTISGIDRIHVQGKHVLVVDDIFDSGHTLRTVMKTLEEKSPKSLRSAVLLAKHIKRDFSFQPDFVLFTLEDKFVIGYGLDYKEHYRGLRGIYCYSP